MPNKVRIFISDCNLTETKTLQWSSLVLFQSLSKIVSVDLFLGKYCQKNLTSKNLPWTYSRVWTSAPPHLSTVWSQLQLILSSEDFLPFLSLWLIITIFQIFLLHTFWTLILPFRFWTRDLTGRQQFFSWVELDISSFQLIVWKKSDFLFGFSPEDR